MDNNHEIGDFVTIKPYRPVVGKVIKIHENGQITLRWPSGMESVHEGENFQTYLSAHTAEILSEPL
jgi:hypothetical protein